MSVLLLVVVAVVTVGSRVAALAILPPPRGALAGIAERLPAPLFAALAALSIMSADGGVVDPPLLAAVACALLAATQRRSLLITLAAGIVGYLVAELVW